VSRNDKEELYRRLAQARRMIREPLDSQTRVSISSLINEIEQHIAAIEARDADAPE
jgi:DNA-binding GntR family transcriptional regulator